MTIPPDWIQWIATNIALNRHPAELTEILVNSGFNRAQADHEVTAAKNHPYVRAARQLGVSLKKREWLLLLLDKKFQSKHKYDLTPEPLPAFADFLRDYYFENRPGLFSNAVKHWPAAKWTPESLRQAIGSSEVEVQYGRTKDAKYEENRDHFRKVIPFDQFVDEVLAAGQSNDLYMTANNITRSQAAMRKVYPDLGNIGDGYLNLDNMDNKCFVWLGPAGTLTPLHHDLTNNLFVQIYGRKRFLLIPANQVPYVYNERNVYTQVDAFVPDDGKYPLYKNATVIELILHPGDTLFIPLGWWHAVESLDISISVSFTNFNAPNNYIADYPGSSNY